MRLLLASASPRRRELLTQIGLSFEVAAQNVDERVLPNENPAAYVSRVASLKAESAVASLHGGSRSDTVVLAADTVVVIDGDILGKPVDRAAAIAMLTRLAGTQHQVLTAIVLRRGADSVCRVVDATVQLCAIDDATVERYVDTGEPFDKAGGYGVQGIAGMFVERVEGSYSTVVGLPLTETEQALTSLGFDTWAHRADSRQTC